MKDAIDTKGIFPVKSVNQSVSQSVSQSQITVFVIFINLGSTWMVN